MIDHITIRNNIINGLHNYLGVLVIQGNSVNEKPDYPYFSYIITTTFNEEFENPKENSFNQLTNTRKEDGTIVFSFKSLSNNLDESINKALLAHKYFKLDGIDELYENGITVKEVTSVQNRDIMLIEQYEFTNGFDVIFRIESNLTKNIINIENVNIEINK